MGLEKEKVGKQEHEFVSLEKGIRDGEHRRIVDFDGHFEDIEQDFTNSYLNK